LSSYHGIGAQDLSTDEIKEFDSWKKSTTKDITNCRVIVFSGKGWLTWKKVVMIDVSLSSLFDTLVQHVSPTTFESMSALEKQKWRHGDMILQNYLAVRLSETVRMSVTDAQSANAIWIMLEDIYANTSLNTQNQLTDEWHALKQKPGQTIHQFIQSIDYMAMTMMSAGVPRTEQDKLYRLFRGVSNEWTRYTEMCTANRSDYRETCSLFIEIGRSSPTPSQGHPEVKAFIATTPRYGLTRPAVCMTCGAESHGSGDCPSGLKRGVDANGRFIVRCFNCMLEGHVRKDCPKPKKSWGAIRAGRDAPKGARAAPIA
jgi:hypothetical protein